MFADGIFATYTFEVDTFTESTCMISRFYKH